MPQVDRLPDAHRPVPGPAAGAVAPGHQQSSAGIVDGVVQQQVELGTQQLQVAEVAAQQQCALGGDGDGVENHPAPELAVPAVHPAPPHAVALLARLPGGPHVVRNDAAVGADAVQPRLHVVQHPAAVLLLSRVEVGVGHQRGGGEVVGAVAVQHHAVEGGDDLRDPFRCLVPVGLELRDYRIEGRMLAHRLGFPRQVFSGVGTVQDRLDRFHVAGMQPGTDAGLKRRAEYPVARIVVGRLGILAHVHGGEAARPAHVLGTVRVGQAEVVERHVALALVMPLGAGGLRQVVVLVVDLRVERPPQPAPLAEVHVELVVVAPVDDAVVAPAGGRVPLLQRHLRHPLVRAHGVEQAPVGEPFVQVVHVVGEVQGAAGLGVLGEHGLGRLLHGFDQPPLHERPRRRRRQAGRGYGVHGAATRTVCAMPDSQSWWNR